MESLHSAWGWSTLGEVAIWGSGGTPKRTVPGYFGGNIPWLIIGDLTDGPVAAAATSITEEGLQNSSAKWVEPGSILLAMYGSIGKLGIAETRLTTNQAIAFAVPNQGRVLPR
ncbi:MAG: restriction endonuclease subunit S, partial [Actinomycetota bacterium]